MTSLPQILIEIKRNPNYIPPISSFRIGRRMFNTGISFDECLCDDMRAGWLSAEGSAAFMAFVYGGVAASDAVLAATV